MQLIVNGEKKLLSQSIYLADALVELGYPSDLPIAVAVNNFVIHKQAFTQHSLRENDLIEILMPMQGG